MAYDFKKEEEVKEYIKNLGTEYRFGCFSEKNPEVCHLLGDFLESIDKDYTKAGKVYKSTCDDYKFARSCYKTANYIMAGKGGFRQSQEEGLKYYEKGCQYNDKDSCFRAGVLSILNSRSKNPTATFRQGLDNLTKGCSSNHAEACHHLSAIYMDGEESIKLAKDMSKAFSFALKACDLGSIYACVNVSIMYKKGDGVEMDHTKSDKYKDKAVEMKKQEQQNRQIVFQEGLNQG